MATFAPNFGGTPRTMDARAQTKGGNLRNDDACSYGPDHVGRKFNLLLFFMGGMECRGCIEYTNSQRTTAPMLAQEGVQCLFDGFI